MKFFIGRGNQGTVNSTYKKLKKRVTSTPSISNFTYSSLHLIAKYKSVLQYENIATKKLHYLLHISMNGLINDSDDCFRVDSGFVSH